MKKRDLEILLEKIPVHPSPRPDLEQYSTPASIAADILFIAHSFGDIFGKKIVDLGCGTGIFSIGAKLLGGRDVVGVDIDPLALDIAREYADNLGILVSFKLCEIKDLEEKGDVVLQNPPFGAQRRHADQIFIKKALEIAPIVYTLHLSKTMGFVTTLAEKLGGKMVFKKNYKWRIKHTFNFHTREKREIEVSMLRIER